VALLVLIVWQGRADERRAETPAVGDVFRIVDVQGDAAVQGTFAGLAEGATFSVGRVSFRISYVGGTGNDVTLTVTAVPPPPPGGGPNLSVESYSDSPDPTSIGGNTTFTARVSNLGPGASTDTRVNLKFDPSWSFISGSFSNGSSGSCVFESAASRGAQLSRVRCEVGALASGAGVTATAVMQPTQNGTFTSKAKAKAKAETDSDLSNNGRTETTAATGLSPSRRR
jgi:hypothetical protein